MEFEKIEEIQALLDKTTSTQDRLLTNLLLLNHKFSELKEVLPRLQSISGKLKKVSLEMKPNSGPGGPPIMPPH
jgi:hypothetical protein